LLSPILVRPIREQLEHDRVIRLLQAKYKRKFDVAMNPGKEQTASVAVGASPWYPDLVLQSADGRRKLLGTVEVETAESINHLEAMSQWGTFARLRAPFHLYVPVSSVDTAKRLCAALQISAAEIWAYNSLGDEILFTLVHRSAVRKRHAAAPARVATKAKGPVSSSRKPAGRKAAGKSRKTTAKKPVARAAGIARAAKAAKAAKLKKVAKSTKSTKSAKAVRAARAARTTKKKASRSSGPKKRK
jgi:hypothetical protein